MWKKHHVAGLHDHAVGRHELLERLAVHAAPVVTEVVHEVDEHAAALHAVERHVLEAEVVHERDALAAVGRCVGLRSDQVVAHAVAVVEDRFLVAVAVGVELGTGVREQVHCVEYCSESVTWSSAHTSTYFGWPYFSI